MATSTQFQLNVVKTRSQKHNTPLYPADIQKIRDEISAFNRELNKTTNPIPMTYTEGMSLLSSCPKQTVGNTERYLFSKDIAKEFYIRCNTENRDVALSRATNYVSDVDHNLWQENNPLPLIFNIRTDANGVNYILCDDGGGRLLTAALRGPLWLTVSIGAFYDENKQHDVRTVLRISSPATKLSRAQVSRFNTGEIRNTILETILKLYLRPTTPSIKNCGLTQMDIESKIVNYQKDLENAVVYIKNLFATSAGASKDYPPSKRPAFMSAYLFTMDENPSLVDEFFKMLFFAGENTMPEQTLPNGKVISHPIMALRKKLYQSINGSVADHARPHFLQSFIRQAFRWYVEYVANGRNEYSSRVRYFSNSLFI